MKNTIDIGLEIASKKTEVKLESRFAVFTTVPEITLPIAQLTIIPQKIIKTIELIIPNIFLTFLLSSNSPTPNVERAI